MRGTASVALAQDQSATEKIGGKLDGLIRGVLGKVGVGSQSNNSAQTDCPLASHHHARRGLVPEQIQPADDSPCSHYSFVTQPAFTFVLILIALLLSSFPIRSSTLTGTMLGASYAVTAPPKVPSALPAFTFVLVFMAFVLSAFSQAKG